MLLWIVIGVVVLALAVYAFWPHKRGVVDSRVSRKRSYDRAVADLYDGEL